MPCLNRKYSHLSYVEKLAGKRGVSKVKFSYLLFSCLLIGSSSCSSKVMKENPDISLEKFDTVTAGLAQVEVLRNLGQASEIERSNGGETWYYDDRASIQRAAVAFNTTGQVRKVTVIPSGLDKEHDLNFLINVKFKGLQFEKITSQKCLHKDFSQNKIYYLNRGRGLLIEQNTQTKEIVYIWGGQEISDDLKKKTEHCKG